MFFIKASVKDRIERLSFVITEPESSFLTRLDQYLTARSYKLMDIGDGAGITYEGLVAPSWFMAVFLTSLAAGGFLCLGLVLNYIYNINWFLGLAVLSPLAGLFYWKKSERLEQVIFTVQDKVEPKTFAITGHRDELHILKQSLQLKPIEID
jgi:Cofactor assembly of complex C subunit B